MISNPVFPTVVFNILIEAAASRAYFFEAEVYRQPGASQSVEFLSGVHPRGCPSLSKKI
ncbi:MAG: hypothetical protein ABSF52_15930 [Syntrophobacteraceae bacterium]|jgi:hypothetical protein